MNESNIPVIWKAIGPPKWPPAPKTMSFSRLKEINACPRRWALNAANYPQIWDSPGYPERLRISTTIGRIVHLVLEKITVALADAGCSSVKDPNAVEVLRGIGGYSQIINECTNFVLANSKNNPRAVRMQQIVGRSIRSQVGELRERVQIMLTNIRLQPRAHLQMKDNSCKSKRYKFTSGSHPEVSLIAPELGWVGVADLISISNGECEIVDFKTGQPREDHSFQLQVYSLLWARDSERNPAGRYASRLTLSYPTGNVDVAVPSPSDLDELESQLSELTRAALQAISNHPPDARPGLETCRYCGVRQICEEYWKSVAKSGTASEASEKPEYCDVEVRVNEEHGPSSWNATVEASKHFNPGDKLLLRTTPDDACLQAVLGASGRVRVLDAYLTTVSDDENEPKVLNLGSRSEAFLVT